MRRRGIRIAVFGFSRGAAAARHFVSLLNDKRPLAARLGAPQAGIEIKFVGVFDTVSSRGMGLVVGNDVAALGLALGGVPKHVVHLTAGNEYRQNFSLTDVTSSLGNGYELTLPGAHSNIGGGYGEVEDESREMRLDERDHYIKHGWYTADETPIQRENVYSPQTGQKLYERQFVIGNRKGLRYDYQFIPLGIMADCAQQHGAMTLAPLTTRGRFGKYTLPPGHPLLPVQSAIRDQVQEHGASGRHVLKLLDDARPGMRLALNPDQIRLLRHHFLHRSAGLGFWLDGRKGMSERRENDKPKREVLHG